MTLSIWPLVGSDMVLSLVAKRRIVFRGSTRLKCSTQLNGLGVMMAGRLAAQIPRLTLRRSHARQR